MEGFTKHEARGVVQDRTIYEDAEVFAAHLHEKGHIDDRDWRTYDDLYRTLRAELAPPDLMIYLRCPMPVLRKRIRLRGRAYEKAIPLPYLKALDRLYEKWFESYDLSPSLVLDTSELDYVTQLFDRKALMDEIERRLR
jgi:deoxyadenosine/deoxycytidine kinase